MISWMKWSVQSAVILASLVGLASSAGRVETTDAVPPLGQNSSSVAFMRQFITRVNPVIVVEDAHCAQALPAAIAESSARHELDWQSLFVLAWQESYFDCHAKNPRDRGGAYGPYQIRRLWEPVVGDPRENYFDPYRATERAAKVLTYYLETERLQRLTERRFRYPLLCLYNTGESRRVNMKYCRTVSSKMRMLQDEWDRFSGAELLAARGMANPSAGRSP